MIVTLNDTTASKIGGAIVEARRTVGSGSGLVHTLICICDSSHFDAAFEAARDAARQHPSRLLMVVTTRSRKDKLDAEVHAGEGTPGMSSCCGFPEPWRSVLPQLSFRCYSRTPPSLRGGPSPALMTSPRTPSEPLQTAASPIRQLTKIRAKPSYAVRLT